MMDAATKMRMTFTENMRKVALGAQVARLMPNARVWTITQQKNVDCGVWLTLQHGRRSFRVYVPVCISGPALLDAGLKSVALAPIQRPLC